MKRRLSRFAATLGVVIAAWTGHVHAQANGIHEEILGVDLRRNVVAYVERSPTVLSTFSHVAIVEVASDGTMQRVRLTTDEDITQCRARDAGSTCAAVNARIQRDIDAARGRLQPASVLPVSQPLGSGSCVRAPFAASQASLPDGLAIRVEPAADGSTTRLTFSRNGRGAPPIDVPSVTVTQGGTQVRAPYDRIADVRELPNGENYAVLLRSDACTPEGQAVPVRLIRLAPPPYAERALQPLVHAEFTESEIVRALSPRARRRTVDETAGWYDRQTRIVFDNAWALPPTSGSERFLVQFTRVEPDMPPPIVDAGQAYAQFAIFTRNERGALRVIAQISPAARDNVFEGNGQEAMTADLDGDGRAEIVVRARYRPDGEIATVLRVSDDAVQFVWRGQILLDERRAPTATNPTSRRCDMGVDGTTLVLRCRVATYRPNAAPNDPPLTAGRLVQRLQWNGAIATVTEERH